MFFKGCENAKAALHTPGVVVVDIVLNRLDEGVLTGKAPAVITFPFQNTPETLHRAIVNAVRNAGHALRHASIYQFQVETSVCML